MNEEGPRKVIVTIDPGVAKPIPVNSESSSLGIQNNVILEQRNPNIDVNQVNEVNDIVKVVDVKYSPKTVIIMVIIIVILVAIFLIFELPMILEV